MLVEDQDGEKEEQAGRNPRLSLPVILYRTICAERSGRRRKEGENLL
jgi:hypothetical protein